MPQPPEPLEHGQPATDGADGAPAGELYDWYRRGVALLESGDAAAAAQLLARAHTGAPESASIGEAHARALFDAGRYAAAASAFGELVELVPGDDYARFGLGLSLSRLDRLTAAAEHLALAVAMRPDRREYTQALRHVRATLRAREEAASASDVASDGAADGAPPAAETPGAGPAA
ncbi:MAG TPA: tetratricopeptide repeat protein [Motilibacteraceae bacterium]|nr:tetratricopeptide repeat protein [Motilibacteraceae bacterium]